MNKTDLEFLKYFAMIIGGLTLLALILILGARWQHDQNLPAPSQISQDRTAARIAPVADVYAGENGQAAMAAAKAAETSSTSTQAAYGGSMDGADIYGKLCGACHTSGVAGAPPMTQVAWAARTAQGMDTLIKHAIEGYQGQAGMMPARGGNPALSDEQVAVTVQWMVDSLK